MVEALQIWDMANFRTVHLLILFFLFFVIVPIVWVKIKSLRYSGPYKGTSLPATVVIPVHKEDVKLFEQCVKSVVDCKPQKIIVSIDSGDQDLIGIAKKYGAEVIEYPQRVGKRQAMADAWKAADTDIIVHVDSDVILDPECLNEITKPLADGRVAAVSTRHISLPGKSRLAYMMSYVIDNSNNINGRALNGHLVVVQGRCNAWRKSFLLSIRNKFLNERLLGRKCEIGEDRFLSREATRAGYNTVHQDSAKIYVHSHDDFIDFIKQQIRWRRSGTRYWLLDLVQGVHPSALYSYKCIAYYLAPIFFLTAIYLDQVYFHLSIKLWSHWWLAIIVAIAGTIIVTFIRQIIYFGRIPLPKFLPLQGIFGLFLILPVALYGTVTMPNQGSWLTRGGRKYLSILPVAIFMVPVIFSFALAQIISPTEYL